MTNKVNIGQALKLKELGFSGSCTASFSRDWHDHNHWHEFDSPHSFMDHNSSYGSVSRPPVVDALCWLREKMDVWAYPIRYEERGKWLYDYNFYDENNRLRCSDEIFDSWDLAESAALDWSLGVAMKEFEKLRGCEGGNHDVIPILGFENSVIGETCRQCGIRIS